MDERQLQQLENDGLSDVVEFINSQKQRIAELTAHVERLRESMYSIRELLSASDVDCLGSSSEGQLVWPVRDEVICDISRILNKTPAQSLATIESNGIEKMLENVYVGFDGTVGYGDIENYVKQLRGEV